MCPEKGYIYFLKAKDRDLFKIGRTFKNPQSRLKQLATGCPYELELFRFFESVDSKVGEKNVHEHFEQYQTTGEWFEVSEEAVLDYIRSLDEITDVALENKNFKVFENKFLVLRCKIGPDSIKITTEKCPFCGKIHQHGTGGKQYVENPEVKEGITHFGHRVSHCEKKNVEILLPNGIKVNNNDGYYLGLY